MWLRAVYRVYHFSKKHKMIQTGIFLINIYMFISNSQKNVGTRNVLVFYLHHWSSDCKHQPVFYRYFTIAVFHSLSLFLSPDFGAVQKDFTVCEEVSPPTLSPLCVTLNYLSLCLTRLNNHSYSNHCIFFFLLVLDSCLLYILKFLMVYRIYCMDSLIATNPLD